MQRLEVSGAVRLLYGSLGVKGLSFSDCLVSSPWQPFLFVSVSQVMACACAESKCCID